jgi:hypothetical protein
MEGGAEAAARGSDRMADAYADISAPLGVGSVGCVAISTELDRSSGAATRIGGTPTARSSPIVAPAGDEAAIAGAGEATCGAAEISARGAGPSGSGHGVAGIGAMSSTGAGGGAADRMDAAGCGTVS